MQLLYQNTTESLIMAIYMKMINFNNNLYLNFGAIYVFESFDETDIFNDELSQNLLGKQFYSVMQKNANKTYKYRQLFTETYLSSASNGGEGEMVDKNVYKAIKQNNVEYLVDKDHQATVEMAQLYDQQKELSAIIVDIRKRFDQTKIQTSKLEKNIGNLQEERQYLRSQIEKAQQQIIQTRNNHNSLESKHHNFQESLQYLEYMKQVRLGMQQRLKHDILHYKKQIFDSNVILIRLKTCIKQQNQKSVNRKNLQTRSKVVLNTLQETVKLRQTERQSHLKQVQTLLMRKIQNSDIKTNREQQIKQSMYKALTQRLPQQTFLLKKLYCELFLRKILRNKMNNLIQQYKEVEHAFNTIKKQTKIANVAEFIQDYLKKDERYGSLLQSIQKNEKKITKQKQQSQILQNQKAKLQLQSAEIDQLYHKMNHKQKQDGQIYKKLVFYNEEAIKCEEFKIMLMRWATKTNASLSLINNQASNEHQVVSHVPNNIATLKKVLTQALKNIQKGIVQTEKQISTPQKQSELKTQFSEQKFNLRTLTSESVLSKEYSRKNFRVRTMTGHQQAPQEHDNQYDDLSEYDFLKHNRRMVKKNNIKSQRPRIKTKLF